MKKFLFILSFFCFILGLSQSTVIDSKVTFADGKKTNAKIRFRISFIYENEIYENSITQKNVVFVNEKGKKKSIFLMNSKVLNL